LLLELDTFFGTKQGAIWTFYNCTKFKAEISAKKVAPGLAPGIAPKLAPE
jgi:hypothetical protein